MERKYNDTHLAILNSAKKSFMEKGFEKSNLREICKNANVTTGAFYKHFTDKQNVFEELVKSVINELKTSYFKSENNFFNLTEETSIDSLWKVNDEAIDYFIDFIYRNFDVFELLLCHSDGTPYENFVHDVSKIETDSTMRFMEMLNEKGYKVKKISKKIIHMLIQACFTSVFEIIIHNYNKDEAKKYIKTVAEFYEVGWKHLFGI